MAIPDYPVSSISVNTPPPKLASKTRRLLTSIIDNFLIDIIVFIVSFGISFIVAMSGNRQMVMALSQNPFYSFGLSISLIFIYYFAQESLFGRTIGKVICGTKVVSRDGNELTAEQVVGRTFCRLIPFEAFSFLGADGKGWHDSIPGTIVVTTR